MSSQEIVSLIFTIVAALAIAAIFGFLFYGFIYFQIKDIHKGNKDLEVIKNIIDEKDPAFIKKQHHKKLAKNIALYTVLGLMLPFFVFMVISRATNGVSKFGDKTVLVISSGSMSKKNPSNDYLNENNLNNQIKTYDIVSFKESNVINQYDVIAYKGDDNKIIVHRVIDSIDLDGEIHYITRGDANSTNDPYKPANKDILGTYTNRSVPFFGVFILFFQSFTGIVTLLLIAYVLILISVLYEKYHQAFVKRQKYMLNQIDFTDVTYEDVEVISRSEIIIKDKKYVIDEKAS